MLTKRELLVGAVLVLGVVGVSVVAGPLSPPAGPISSTSPSLGDLQTTLDALAGGGTGNVNGGTVTGVGMLPLGVSGAVTDNLDVQATGGRLVVTVSGLNLTSLFSMADIRRGVEVVENGQGSAGATYDVVEPVTKIVLVRQFFGVAPGLLPDLAVWTDELRNDPAAPRRDVAVTYFPPDVQDPAIVWSLTECVPLNYDIRVVGDNGYEVLELVVGSISQSIQAR